MDLWDLRNAKNGDEGADSASNASSETLRFRDIQRRQSTADASQTLEEPFEYIRHFTSTRTGLFHAFQGQNANRVQVDASKNEDTTAEDVETVPFTGLRPVDNATGFSSYRPRVSTSLTSSKFYRRRSRSLNVQADSHLRFRDASPAQ